MFITNELNPGEMLAELLKGRRRRTEATKAFAELRHDRDLCPRFADQVQLMLQVYKAYGHEVHDIQGMRDDGIDILMRYEDRDGNERRAGLQVKSEDEFKSWADGKLQLPQIAKAQYATAMANGKLDEFYVVLCVNAVEHQRRIRMLCSELKNFSKCTIIEPVDVLDFYEMGHMDLWARTTRILCGNDLVLARATEEADAEAPDVAYFLIDLVCRATRPSYRVTDEDLFEIWARWEDFAGENAGTDERLSDILQKLLESGAIEDDGGIHLLRVGQLPGALCALYFDLRARGGDTDADLRDQIATLVQLGSRLGPDEEDEDEEEDE